MKEKFKGCFQREHAGQIGNSLSDSYRGGKRC